MSVRRSTSQSKSKKSSSGKMPRSVSSINMDNFYNMAKKKQQKLIHDIKSVMTPKQKKRADSVSKSIVDGTPLEPIIEPIQTMFTEMMNNPSESLVKLLKAGGWILLLAVLSSPFWLGSVIS